MALKSGTSTSYRPSDTHIGSERLSSTLKIINKRKNKNETITEGLELVAIKDVGSIEEKLKAMSISYKDIIEYLATIDQWRGLEEHHKLEMDVSSTPLNRDRTKDIKIDDEVIITKETAVIKENEKFVATGINMISTMSRE